MFCKQCGKQLPEGTRFCDACGTQVNPPETSQVSPKTSQSSKSSQSLKSSKPSKSKKPLIIGLCIGGAAVILVLLLLYFLCGFGDGNFQDGVEDNYTSHKVTGLVTQDGQYSYYLLVNPEKEEERIVRSDGQNFSEDHGLLAMAANSSQGAEGVLNRFVNEEAADWPIQAIFAHANKVYYFYLAGSGSWDAMTSDSLNADYELRWISANGQDTGTLMSTDQIRAYDQQEDGTTIDNYMIQVIQDSPNIFQYGSKLVFSNGSVAAELDLQNGHFQSLTSFPENDSYMVGYEKGSYYYIEAEEDGARLYRWQSSSQAKSGTADGSAAETAELVCSLPELNGDWTSLANVTCQEGYLYYSDASNVYRCSLTTGETEQMTPYPDTTTSASSCSFALSGDYLYCSGSQGFYQYSLDNTQSRSIALPTQLEGYEEKIAIYEGPSGSCWLLLPDADPVYYIYTPDKETSDSTSSDNDAAGTDFILIRDKTTGTAESAQSSADTPTTDNPASTDDAATTDNSLSADGILTSPLKCRNNYMSVTVQSQHPKCFAFSWYCHKAADRIQGISMVLP